MHPETLFPNTEKLLLKLNGESLLENFRLVGGTALALQLGHRKSIDLDFFTREKFDVEKTLNGLQKGYDIRLMQKFPAGLLLYADDVKFDVIRHDYPWLEPPVVFQEIKMAGIKDIAAMKLNAICGRGNKKDFFDLYALLEHFDLSEMINLFQKKYQNFSSIMVLKSLAYFDDAERDANPKMLQNVSWQKVKSIISSETKKL